MMGGLKIYFKKYLMMNSKLGLKKNNITYEHKLVDDMVACAMKWSGKIYLGM